MDEPEILFVVPCDDIRQEANGKFIIIGMYTESFLPSSLPLNFSMSFFIWMRLPKPGAYTVACEIFIEPNPKPVAKFGFDFVSDEASERAGVPLPPVPLLAGQEGAIVLRMGSEPKEVCRLPISLPSGSTA